MPLPNSVLQETFLMKSIIIKALSAIFAAALVLGVVTVGISFAFNAEGEGGTAVLPSAIQASPYASGSAPTEEVPDLEYENGEKHDIVIDGSSKPAASMGNDVVLGNVSIPLSPGSLTLMGGEADNGEDAPEVGGEVTEGPEANESTPDDSQAENSEVEMPEGMPEEVPEAEEPVVTPPVTAPSAPSANLINTLLSYNYTNGIDTFGAINGADTSALYNAIHQGSNVCSFVAIRISDGACIAYNVDRTYRCASSYKAFASLYAYKQAAAGVLDMNAGLKYTYSDYYGGSGIIKSSPVGSVYTLRQIADYSIRYSDNIAFIMLQRYLDRQGLVDYAKSLGCPNADGFEYTWPDVSALDAAIWWSEIYNFSKTSSYGAELYNVCLNATNPSIKKGLNNEHPVAHKSGSMSYYFHDCGVVESEDPYILAVYTYNPYNYSSVNQTYFSSLVQEIDKIINP